MTEASEPDHEVLERPWEHRIAELRWVPHPDEGEPHLDLRLRKDGADCVVRFLSPRGLRIDEGFEPASYVGLRFTDVSARRVEGEVHVSCFENTPGLEFRARAAVRIE